MLSLLQTIHVSPIKIRHGLYMRKEFDRIAHQSIDQWQKISYILALSTTFGLHETCCLVLQLQRKT